MSYEQTGGPVDVREVLSTYYCGHHASGALACSHIMPIVGVPLEQAANAYAEQRGRPLPYPDYVPPASSASQA